jgi:predicted enzyme related to lactoylglutathione lyase
MGKVSFELPADDLQRVAVFYKEVFGWSSDQLPFDSAVIDTEGKTPVDPDNSAGVFSKRNEFVKAPVLIITIPDIDATIEKVEGAGGEMLTEKEKVGEFAYSAYGKDTEGTVFCLWEPLAQESE